MRERLRDAHVELPEGGDADRVERAEERLVDAGRASKYAPDDGRAREARRVAEAAADLEAGAEVVRGDRGEDVGLVEVVGVVRLARGVRALAPRQRVRDPAEEALARPAFAASNWMPRVRPMPVATSACGHQSAKAAGCGRRGSADVTRNAVISKRQDVGGPPRPRRRGGAAPTRARASGCRRPPRDPPAPAAGGRCPSRPSRSAPGRDSTAARSAARSRSTPGRGRPAASLPTAGSRRLAVSR